MCGIIGINSNKPVSATIINSLKKLEYRGYDSAGIATLYSGSINEIKSEGRVDNLEKNSLVKKISFSLAVLQLSSIAKEAAFSLSKSQSHLRVIRFSNA